MITVSDGRLQNRLQWDHTNQLSKDEKDGIDRMKDKEGGRDPYICGRRDRGEYCIFLVLFQVSRTVLGQIDRIHRNKI